MPSVLIDLVSVILALYALFVWTSFGKKGALLPVAIATTYLVAQSGWTASFLSGNLWGAEMNNYIWFVFNTLVFVHLIKGAKPDGQ